LVTFTAETFEIKRLSQPGPSGISQTTNRSQQINKAFTSINSNKVIDNVSSSSKKRTYEELCDNNVSGDSGKHTYEDLFGDISDLLKTDISGQLQLPVRFIIIWI